MPRFVLPALLILTASPALAASDAAENCTKTTAIVADAVAERSNGNAKAETVKTLKAGDIESRFAPTVQPLVEWVYTLPEDQLTDAAPAAFKAACLEQAG